MRLALELPARAQLGAPLALRVRCAPAPGPGLTLRVSVDPPGGGRGEPFAAAASEEALVPLAERVAGVGLHRVRVALVRDLGAAEALAEAQVETRVERASAARLAASVDARVLGAERPWVHGVVDATARAWALQEDDWSLRPRRQRELGPAAAGAGALAVVSNFGRGDGVACWWAWREGDVVCAKATLHPSVGRLELGPDLLAVIEPALMTADGSLEVFAVLAGAARNRLVHARFPPPGAGLENGPGALVSERPLPGPAAVLRAALGPEREGARREVVVAGEGPEGLVVHRLVVGEPTAAWERVDVPAVSLVPGDGDVRASAARTDAAWLVEHEGELGLAKVWWKGAGPGKGDVVPAAERPDAILAGVVRYGLAPGSRELAWAVWTGTQVVHSRAWRRPLTPPRPPARPLLLLPLRQPWLALEPAGEPELVALV